MPISRCMQLEGIMVARNVDDDYDSLAVQLTDDIWRYPSRAARLISSARRRTDASRGPCVTPSDPSNLKPERPSTALGLVGTVIDAVIDGRLDWVKTARLLIIVVAVITVAAVAPVVVPLWLTR